MKIEFGNTEHAELQTFQSPAPKKKGSLFPVLVVLFLFSYGLMTMLIVEQGRTIDSQRALIRELFRDSTELSATKLREQQQEHARAHAQGNQTPSTQTPDKQVPSTQGNTQQNAKADKPKSQVQAPSRPAADLSDIRRALITI